MENEWVKVYAVGTMVTAEIIKGMLAENNINCNILNQQDSELMFGDIDLYVEASNETMAKKLIDEHNPAE